jgi:colanic acid/amylovoran biosynthesis protein
LIINQHGENRGDEAAMRAMLHELERHLRDVKFTLVCQFRDRGLRITLPQNATIHSMVMPLDDALGLFLFAALKRIGLPVKALLTALGRSIIESYETADLVISAPGGPYFGDIYWKHEWVHWFFASLAALYRKPMFLYAPSAGPFRNRFLNIIRRRLFRSFDGLCVRENLSRQHFQDAFKGEFPVEVTADSALQREIAPLNRASYFAKERPEAQSKFLVSVSALNYAYPGERDVSAKRASYDEAIVAGLMHLHSRNDCHFLFLPQLYGRVHSDVPYLRSLAERLPAECSWEIIDAGLNSDDQQGLIGMTDFCIASRYHPQIFAASAGVPGVCIYYEHKAIGFMKMLGLAPYAVDIRTITSDQLIHVITNALEKKDRISEQMKSEIVALRRAARRTTELAVDIIRNERPAKASK